jgi:uncharacterized protein YxjI
MTLGDRTTSGANVVYHTGNNIENFLGGSGINTLLISSTVTSTLELKSNMLVWNDAQINYSNIQQIHVYDAAHVEVGMIRQKLFNLLPVFEIETGGIKRGQIEKQFTLFQPKYDIDFNGWRVEGDFLGWDYDVYSGCSSIIHISKQLLHWGDTYVIDFTNPGDELLGMMLVIAIDAANCSQNK